MGGNDKYLDDVFRNGLENIEVTPPDEVWNNIDDKINNGRRRNFLLILQVAAGIAVLAVTSYLLISINDNPVHQQELSNTEQTDQKGESFDLNQEYIPRKNEMGVSDSDAASQKRNSSNELNNTNKDVGDRIVSVDIQQESVTQMVGKDAAETFIYKENKSVAAVANKEKSITNKLRLIESVLGQDVHPENESLLAINENRVTENVVDKQPENKKKQANAYWELAGFYGSVYTDRLISSAVLDPVQKSVMNAAESGLSSFGGGMGVRYNYNRWSVESGVYYSKFGQKNQQVLSQESAINNSYGRVVNNPMYESSKSTYLVNNSLGVISYNSPNESITSLSVNFKSGSTNQDGNGNEELRADLVASSNGINFNDGKSSIIQLIDFIEIPMVFRYKLFDKKVDINIIGGFGANIVSGSRAIFETETDKKQVGSIARINEVNLSSTVGIGFGYELNSAVTFHLEPTAKMFLNSLNHELPINYYPYQIGVFTGVSYSF